METPSSTKRVTRSQTLLALNNGNNNSSVRMLRKIEESETGVIKSRRRNYNQQQQDRSALIDITNDSPIVGLAMDSLETPSSTTAKQRGNRIKKAISSNTPGSGEALLRCQVKSLLQKVEEEAAADLSKIATENRPFLHLLQGFVSSPMGLVAPTPANTPQVPNVNEDGNNDHNDGWDDSFTPLPVIEEQLKICQQVVSEMIIDGKKQESQKSLTRSLMLDFSEKSEVTDASSEYSSVMTSFDDALTATSESKGKSSSSSPLTDDDSASNWSIQGNASIHDDDEDEEEEQQLTEEEDAFYYHPDNDDDDGLVDELCEGIGKMKVSEDVRGKHTRFVYNSDDEIVEAEEVLHLKGLPTPKGKHLRFPVEEEEH